jgi:hypothetical protein
MCKYDYAQDIRANNPQTAGGSLVASYFLAAREAELAGSLRSRPFISPYSQYLQRHYLSVRCHMVRSKLSLIKERTRARGSSWAVLFDRHERYRYS